MFRDLGIVTGAMWLLAASVMAPFWHLHPGDPDHRHGSGLSHAHFAEVHEDHGLEIEPHDDGEVAVWLDWAPAAQPRFDIAFFTAPVGLVQQIAFVPQGVAAEIVVRSHGPPSLRLLPPRAPPL